VTVEPPAPPLRIGRVLGAHGVQGDVRVESLTDFPERFHPGARVEVGGHRLTIRTVARYGDELRLRFDEINDRDAAAALLGAYLTVPLAEARALPADHFYHFQLVGLRVRDQAAGELGTVLEVLTYPANDVLRVQGGRGEVLVPMVKAIVRAVDLQAGVIDVDLKEESDA
jgi:16S rRNA processing protein RimM